MVKHALELKKPVILLNVGPSRADALAGVEKIDMPSGSVMREAARAIMYVVLKHCVGSRKFTVVLAELERSKTLLYQNLLLSGRHHLVTIGDYDPSR